MNNVCFSVKVHKDGSLKIPPFAVRGLGYQPGDDVDLALPADQPECEICCCDDLFIMRRRSDAFCPGYTVQEDEVNIPLGLFNEAGVPVGTTVYVMAGENALVLAAGTDDCEDLPAEIHCLLEELDIDVGPRLPLALDF